MMWKRLKTISSPPPAKPLTTLWLDLADRRIAVRVTHRPQAKRMTLRLARQNEAVALTLPLHVSVKKGLDWVQTKRSWVEAQLMGRPKGQAIEPGMTVPFGDESLILDWSPDHRRTVRRVGDRICIGGPQDMMAQRLLRWLRAEAKAILAAETGIYAARAGVRVEQVGVGDPVSRWGSCSASGAIRYSWRLVLAPRNVLVATVAHEVAHRVHMNHGPQFHALVAEILGHDPRSERQWLRRHGAELHGFGSTG